MKRDPSAECSRRGAPRITFHPSRFNSSAGALAQDAECQARRPKAETRKKAEIRKTVLTAYQVLYAANKNPVTLYKIGNAKNQLGDRQGARAAYLTAFEMFPDNDTYRGTISRQLTEMAKK